MVPLGRQIRHDPVLGHAFEANINRRIPHEHGAYFSVTNAQGFREDHDLNEIPQGFHVMCYGDSYTAGDGVNNDQRFTSMLASQLGVTVSNVAVPGHGPDQNVLQLERVPLRRPDLILWCIAVHTIERIQSGKRITTDREGRLWQIGRPHFVLRADGALELCGVPVAVQGEELVEKPFPQIQSPAAAAVTEVVAKLRSRLARTLGPYMKAAPDPGYAKAASSEWRLLAALIRRFHASAGDVPVVIVPLPSARYITENHEAHFQQRFAEIESTQSGLIVLDVLNGMRAAPRKDRIGYHYRFDGHFTVAGHAALTNALVEQLQHRGLVQANAHQNTAPTPPTMQLAPAAATLHIAWQGNDGLAQLRSVSDGGILAEFSERTVRAHQCRPGVLPISAVHACLEEGHIAGPELQRIVLCSPCAVADLAAMDREDPRWMSLASGWVRWHGAAAADLRAFLCYEAPIEWKIDGDPDAVRSDLFAVQPDDDEQRWLTDQLYKLRNTNDPRAMQRALLRLSRRWELVTRASRKAVLPTTDPLRRGRIALKLARAATNKLGQK